jgi:hypothetical protein
MCTYPEFNVSTLRFAPYDRSGRSRSTADSAVSMEEAGATTNLEGLFVEAGQSIAGSSDVNAVHTQPRREGTAVQAQSRSLGHLSASNKARSSPDVDRSENTERAAKAQSTSTNWDNYRASSHVSSTFTSGRQRSTSSLLHQPYAFHTIQSANATYHDTRLTPSLAQELELVSHFRYHIALWLDNEDPSGFFGVGLLLMARQSRAVMTAVLAVTLRQLLVTSEIQATRLRPDVCGYFRQEAESKVLDEPEDVHYVVQNMLLLETFLRSRIQDWRNLTQEFLNLSRHRVRTRSVAEDAFWGLWLRIGELRFSRCPPFAIEALTQCTSDVAAAIVTTCQPLTELILLRHPGRAVSSPRDELTVKSTPLLLLAAALSLSYGNSHPESPSSSQSISDAPSDALYHWVELWSDCQTWYRRRSPELCPVFGCKAVEAAQIDPSSGTSFPTELYSSPCALLPNIAYHLACLFLLACKPRTAKPSSIDSSRQALSESWHIQVIAGIASKNEFNEQWDPVLIAALIHVGARLTHKSQRDIVLDCLKTATSLTGLIMQEEMQRLKDTWAAA